MTTIWPVEAAAQVFLQPLLSSAEVFWVCFSRTWMEELPETWIAFIHRIQGSPFRDPFSNSHDSGCQVFVLCLIRPKKYCKFCVFPLRLLASTWHLWSAYRIKPWKAGKLPSVSSLLEISAHLLNLAAFIYSPESSASCWFWLLHSCQLLSAEEVGLLGGHSSIPEMWSHHWRLHFELTAPLLGQRCTSQMFILVNACQLLLKFR